MTEKHGNTGPLVTVDQLTVTYPAAGGKSRTGAGRRLVRASQGRSAGHLRPVRQRQIDLALALAGLLPPGATVAARRFEMGGPLAARPCRTRVATAARRRDRLRFPAALPRSLALAAGGRPGGRRAARALGQLDRAPGRRESPRPLRRARPRSRAGRSVPAPAERRPAAAGGLLPGRRRRPAPADRRRADRLARRRIAATGCSTWSDRLRRQRRPGAALDQPRRRGAGARRRPDAGARRAAAKPAPAITALAGPATALPRRRRTPRSLVAARGVTIERGRGRFFERRRRRQVLLDRRRLRACAKARWSASTATPAAAKPPCCAASPASCRRPAASVEIAGEDVAAASAAPPPRAAPADPDGRPGPRPLGRPALAALAHRRRRPALPARKAAERIPPARRAGPPRSHRRARPRRRAARAPPQRRLRRPAAARPARPRPPLRRPRPPARRSLLRPRPRPPRRQLLELLLGLREKHGLALLFVSHQQELAALLLHPHPPKVRPRGRHRQGIRLETGPRPSPGDVAARLHLRDSGRRRGSSSFRQGRARMSRRPRSAPVTGSHLPVSGEAGRVQVLFLLPLTASCRFMQNYRYVC